MNDSPRASRPRVHVPLERRSVLATVDGVPWWGAIVCAVAAVFIGWVVDALTGDELTGFFTAMYVVGSVAAVLVVRNRSLFTAMVQPPLILSVSVPLAYRGFAEGPSGGMKSLLFDMALPLINRFPTMVATTVVVWIIGALRIAVYVRARRGEAGRTRSATPARSRPGASAGARSAKGRSAQSTAHAHGPVRTSAPPSGRAAPHRGAAGRRSSDEPHAGPSAVSTMPHSRHPGL